MPLGIYISVPFCRSKCSYCNFASGVFSASRMDRYIDRLAEDIAAAPAFATLHGAELPAEADSIYLGGGTPSILEPQQMARLFLALRAQFQIAPNAEITIECAPGMLSDAMLELFPRLGVNRVSLGMQSFIDHEAKAVGRLHTKESTLKDIARLRAAGISNINLDLIAGLPHQTAASWQESVAGVIATGVPHVSVYMLEVDEDSRLGRELIAGGTRYHAHHVPNEDLVADLYITACEMLKATGIHQYEISNFSRPSQESLHNLKYWTRQPYVGFGLDAHGMLHISDNTSLRFSATDDFEAFYTSASYTVTPVTPQQALEEEFFLGLRLNRGLDLTKLTGRLPASHHQIIADLQADGLLEKSGANIRLTARGRLLSNDVFARFLAPESAPTSA
ncbi:MAG: radical SAM family heme chaperone HemW [Terriglobales bacterium]